MRLRRPSVFLVFLMLLLAPGSATAQTAAQEGKWSGRLELVTGLGFHTVLDEDTVKDTLFHLREQVFVQLARTTPTFSFSTQAQGVFVKNETQTLRTTFRGKQEMEMFGRGNNFYQPGSSIRSDFNWRPSPKNQYTAFLTYQYGYDHTDNLTARLSADTLNAFHLKAAQEEKRVHRHTATAGWRATHQLVSPHMMLLTAGDWRASFVDQTSTWTKGDFTFVEDNTNSYSLYRLMPQTGSNEGTVSISLRDTLLRSEHGLTIEPGLRFRLSETRDENSGSTYVDETHWRDSTRLHEDFDFVTLQLDPQFRLEYRYKSLRLSADYSLQFYSRQLTSQLYYQRLEWQPLLVVGRSFADWTPAPGHQLTLGNTLSVTRPSYLQTCWYDRQGEDPSQLFRGNPGLRPARSISTDLTWRFRRGNFNLTANTGVTTATIDKNLQYFQTNALEFAKQLDATKAEKTDLEKRIKALKQQIKEVGGRQYNKSGIVTLELNSPKKQTVTAGIKYYTEAAAWTVTYDLNISDLHSPIGLVMKAHVSQYTGLEWKNVNLTLSTGRPSSGNEAPELSTWWLQQQVARVRSTYAAKNAVYATLGVAAVAEDEVADLAPQAASIQQFVEQSEQALSVEYAISLPYTIAGSGKEQIISLQERQLDDVAYNYFTVPAMDESAYLVAYINGWQQQQLPDGRASLTYNGTYYGETMLATNSDEARVRLTLGDDRQIKIKRELTAQNSKTSGSNKQVTYTYTTTIRNDKSEQVNITLKDRYPVSTAKEIQVSVGDKTTRATNDDKSAGILTYDLKLAPGESKQIVLSYTVKYPKEWRINL